MDKGKGITSVGINEPSPVFFFHHFSHVIILCLNFSERRRTVSNKTFRRLYACFHGSFYLFEQPSSDSLLEMSVIDMKDEKRRRGRGRGSGGAGQRLRRGQEFQIQERFPSIIKVRVLKVPHDRAQMKGRTSSSSLDERRAWEQHRCFGNPHRRMDVHALAPPPNPKSFLC